MKARISFFQRIISLCIVMLFGMFMSIHAQDVIIKKNGEELKTKVMEVSSDEIKYKMWDYQDGPLYTISTSEIFMIKYQNGNKDVMSDATYTGSSKKGKAASVRYPRYRGELNFGYALGLGDNGLDRVVFETVHGSKINQYAFVGIGTGFHAYRGLASFEGYGIEEVWGMTVPIFLDLKGFYPVSDDFSPYIDLGLGASVGVMEIDGTGFLANVGVGINYKKLNVGLNFQSDNKAKGFVFKVGLAF